MKILQADDHQLFRMITRQILSSLDENVIFLEASTADDAITLLAENQDTNLILLDLVMPGMGGLSGLHTIRKKCPKIPVAIISGSEDPSDMKAVIDAGARGYIPKTSSGEVVLSAIRLVLAGYIYRPEALISGLETEKELTKKLTPRQREVFDLLGKGHSNKQIARLLELEEGTVKQHLAKIFKFLGVHNRIEAVIKIRRIKMLE
jgi:DNA-binding NarL/FixJ family response regulator